MADGKEARPTTQLLKEAAGEEVAKAVAELAGADINDIFFTEPSMEEFLAMVNSGFGDAALIVRSVVRGGNREHLLTTQQILDTPPSVMLPIYTAAIEYAHEYMEGVNNSPAGKKLVEIAKRRAAETTSSS